MEQSCGSAPLEGGPPKAVKSIAGAPPPLVKGTGEGGDTGRGPAGEEVSPTPLSMPPAVTAPDSARPASAGVGPRGRAGWQRAHLPESDRTAHWLPPPDRRDAAAGSSLRGSRSVHLGGSAQALSTARCPGGLRGRKQRLLSRAW